MNDPSLSIGWTQDDVHPTLREDLQLNPQVFQFYVQQVKRAVQQSLNHPDTKPRILSAQILRERVALAHKLIMLMREDSMFPLRKVLDLLPGRMLEMLRRGASKEDVVAEASTRAMWGRDDPPVLKTVDLEKVEEIKTGALDADMESALKEIDHAPCEEDD